MPELPSSAAVTPREVGYMPTSTAHQFLTDALEQAKPWLDLAVKDGDPGPLSQFNQWTRQVNDVVRRSRMPFPTHWLALELALRSDRALGVAIRNGQEAGLIRKQSQSRLVEDRYTYRLNDHPRTLSTYCYPLADGVTDEDFEDALAAQRAAGRLGRDDMAARFRAMGNHPRKIRIRKIAELAEQGWTSAQIARALDSTTVGIRETAQRQGIEIPGDTAVSPPRQVAGRHRFVQREALTAMRDSLDALGMVIDTAENQLAPEIDKTEAARWESDIGRARRHLTRLSKMLKERTA